MHEHSGPPSTIQKYRRGEIIAATIESLAEMGYAATSFAEIGRRVGIGKSVVAYHFKSKEALIDAVVNAIYNKGLASVRPAIDAETTSMGQIEAFIRHSIYFYQNYHGYVAALGSLRLHLSSKGTPNTTATVRLHKEMADLTVILRQGQKQGEFRKFSAPIMVRTLRQALDGVIIEMTHHPGGNMSNYADELVTIFKRALQNEESA